MSNFSGIELALNNEKRISRLERELATLKDKIKKLEQRDTYYPYIDERLSDYKVGGTD